MAQPVQTQQSAKELEADEAAWVASDEFRMFHFKISLCNKRYNHDWNFCPYAHIGERACRRDPMRHNYTSLTCLDMLQKGKCPRGDVCTAAHSVFEYWLHPHRYRTEMCRVGPGCNRRICFFAHTPSELRPLPAHLAVADAEGSLASGGKYSLSAALPASGSRKPATEDSSQSANQAAVQHAGEATAGLSAVAMARLDVQRNGGSSLADGHAAVDYAAGLQCSLRPAASAADLQDLDNAARLPKACHVIAAPADPGAASSSSSSAASIAGMTCSIFSSTSAGSNSSSPLQSGSWLLQRTGTEDAKVLGWTGQGAACGPTFAEGPAATGSKFNAVANCLAAARNGNIMAAMAPGSTVGQQQQQLYSGVSASSGLSLAQLTGPTAAQSWNQVGGTVGATAAAATATIAVSDGICLQQQQPRLQVAAQQQEQGTAVCSGLVLQLQQLQLLDPGSGHSLAPLHVAAGGPLQACPGEPRHMQKMLVHNMPAAEQQQLQMLLAAAAPLSGSGGANLTSVTAQALALQPQQQLLLPVSGGVMPAAAPLVYTAVTRAAADVVNMQQQQLTYLHPGQLPTAQGPWLL